MGQCGLVNDFLLGKYKYMSATCVPEYLIKIHPVSQPFCYQIISICQSLQYG